MLHYPFYEKGFFIPAMIVSASVHGLLFGVSGLVASSPYASVINAPSSLEVTVIRQPVVSILEREIVSEEIIESAAFEKLALKDQAKNIVSPKTLLSSEASEASRGAATKALPLAQMNLAPPYPHVARQRGWEGLVRIEVFVDKDGIPRRAVVEKSSGHGVLDKAALTAVEEWKFSPAMSGSTPFASRITIPIQFALIKE